MESLSDLKEIHERENKDRDRDSQRIRDSLSNFSTFETSLALVFSQTLTINDRTDVNFIALILQYVSILLIIKVARGWIYENKTAFNKYTGVFFFEIIAQLIQFYLLLYTYIILREVQAYFNLTIYDAPAIIAIFVFWNLCTQTIAHFASKKKFKLVVQLVSENTSMRFDV